MIVDSAGGAEIPTLVLQPFDLSNGLKKTLKVLIFTNLWFDHGPSLHRIAEATRLNLMPEKLLLQLVELLGRKHFEIVLISQSSIKVPLGPDVVTHTLGVCGFNNSQKNVLIQVGYA